MGRKETLENIIGLEKERNSLNLAVNRNLPALFIGETGLGKTALIREKARKEGKELVRVNLNGEIGISEIIGKYVLIDGSTIWQDGILVQCVKNGWWVVFDELNAALPEILFCLHPLLDDDRFLLIAEKDGEKIVPHKDFRFFATMNPPDEYVGTKDLNKALLSRFPIVLYFKQYAPETEEQIIKHHIKDLPSPDIKLIIDIGNMIRKLKKDGEIFHTCSTRDLIQWGTIFSFKEHSIFEAMRITILNKANMADFERIVKQLKTDFQKLKVDWEGEPGKLFGRLTDAVITEIKELEAKEKRLKKIFAELKKSEKYFEVEDAEGDYI